MRPSYGTLVVLGFKKAKMETPPTCAYIMVGSKCIGKCLFCAQSRYSKSENFLSRITWREEDPSKVLPAIREAYRRGDIKRVCLQVVRGSGNYDKAMEYLKMIKRCSSVPVCVSIAGLNMEEMHALIEAGCDKIALSFDAANPSLFEKIKGYPWEEMWNTYQKCVKEIPDRIVIHLIVGMGETEEDVSNLLKIFTKDGVPTSLFAFTPIRGTPMAKNPPPSISTYRRVQIFYYLLRKGLLTQNSSLVSVKEGKINLNSSLKDWFLENIEGEAFETYGCSGCNRPLYNEKPGSIPYNYPRPLTENERIDAILEAFK